MLRIEKRIIQFGIFDDDNENDWIEEVVEESPTNQQAEKDVWNDTDSPFEVENNQQNNAQQQQQFQQQANPQMNAAQQNYMQQQAYIMQQQQMQAQQIARQQAYQEAVKRATTINPATKKEPMSKKTKIILGSTVGGGLALLAILSGVAYVGVTKSKQKALINNVKNDFEKASAEIQEFIDSHKNNKDKQYSLKVIENLEKSLIEINGKYSQLAKNIKDPNNFKKDVEIFVANLKNNHSSAKSSIIDLETQYVKYKLIKDKYEEIIKNMKNADSSTGLYGSNDLYNFYSQTNKEDSLYFRITNPNSEFSLANKVFSAGTTKKEAEEAVDKLNARWPKWKSELETFKDLYVSMLQTKNNLEVKEKNTADQAVKELVRKQIQEISSLLDLTNKDRDYVSWDTWINQPQVLTAHNLKYYEELINGDENKIKEFSEYLLKYVTPTLEAINNLIKKANSHNKYKDFCELIRKDYTNFTKKSQPYAFDSSDDIKKFDAEVKNYYATKNKEFDDMVALFTKLEKLDKLVNDYVLNANSQTKFKEIFEKAKLYNVNEIVDNSISLDNFKPLEHYKWYLSIKDNVAQYPNTEVYAVLAKTINNHEQYLKNIYRSNNNNLEQMQTTYTSFSNVFKKAIVDICKFEQKRDSTIVAINKTEQWINSLTNFNSYNYDEFRKELRQKLEDDKTKVNKFMDYSEIETFTTFENYLDFYTKTIENVTTSNQDVEKNYKYREQVFKENIDELKQLETTFINNNFLSQPNSFSKYTVEKNNLSIKVQDLLKNKDNSLSFINLKNSLSIFKTKWSQILQGHTELKIAYDALKKAIEDSSLTLNQLQTEFEFLFKKLTQAKANAQNDYDNISPTLEKEFYDNARNTLTSTINSINGEKVEYQKLVDKIDQEIGATESDGYKKVFNQYKNQPYLNVQTKKLFDLYTTNSVSVKKDLKKVSLDQAKQNQINFLNQLSSASNEITTRFGIHEQLDQKIKEITNKLQNAEFKIEPKTAYSYLGEDVKKYLDLAIASLAKNDETNEKWTEYTNGLNSKWEKAVQTYQNHKKAIEDLQALIEQYKTTISSTTNSSSDYKDELFNVIRTEENAYAENAKNLTLNVNTTLEQIQEKTTEITNKKAKILTATGEFALHKVAFEKFNVEIAKFDNIFNQTDVIHNKIVSNFGNLTNNSFADLKNKNLNIKNTDNNFKYTKATTKTSEYQQKLQGIKSLIATSQNEIDTRINIYSTLNINFEQTNAYLTSLQETSPIKFVKTNRQTKFNKHKQEFVDLFTTIPNNYNENNQISEKITNYFVKSQWEAKVNQLVGFGNLIINNWNSTKQVYDEIIKQQNDTSETLSLSLETVTKHNVDKTYSLFKEQKLENNVQINPFEKDKLIETLLAQDSNESFTLFNQYAVYFEKSGNFLAKKDVDLELKKLWVTKFTKEIAIKEIQDEITNNNSFYQITNDYFGINQQRNTNAFIREKLDKFLRIREFEQIKDNTFEEIKAFSQEYTKQLFEKIKKTREDIEKLSAKVKWTKINNYLLKYYTYSKYSGNYPNENNMEISNLNVVIDDQNYSNKDFQIKDLTPATTWHTKSNELSNYLKTIVSSEQNIASTTYKTFDKYLDYYKEQTLSKFNEFFGMQNNTLTNVHKFILKNTNTNAFNLHKDFEGIISSFKSFNKINNIDNTHLYNSEFLSQSSEKMTKWQNDFIDKIEENISKDLDNLDSTSNLWTKYYSSVDAVSTFKETLRNYMSTYNEFNAERVKFKVALDNLNGYLENLKKLKEFVNTHNYFGDVKTEIDSHYSQLEAKYKSHLKGYNEDYKNKSKVTSETNNIVSFISTIKNKNNEIATKIKQQINTSIWTGSSNVYNQFDAKLNELNRYFKSDLTNWFEKINYLFNSIEEANRFKTMVLDFAISKFHLLNKFNEGSHFTDILGIDQNNNNNSFTWLSKVMNELNALKNFSLNSILENQDKKFIFVENNNNISNAMGRSISVINFLNSKGENLINALKPVFDLFEAIFNEFEGIDVLGEVNDSILKSKIYTSAIKDVHIHSKDLGLNNINVNSNNILSIVNRANSILKRNDVKGEITLKSILRIQINNSMSSNTFEINKEQIKSGFFKLGEKNGQNIAVSDILVGENLNLYAKNYNSGSISQKGIFTQKVKKQDEWTLYDGTNNLDKTIDSPYKYLWNKNSDSYYNRKIIVKENENTLNINNSPHYYPSITYYDEQGNQKTIDFTDVSKKYSSIYINTFNTTTNFEDNVKKVKRYHREFLKYYSMLSVLFQENISNSLYELKNDYEVRKMYILLKLFFDSINHKTLEVLDNHTLNYVLAEIFGITNEVFTSFKNKLYKFKTELSSLLNSNNNFKIFDISTGEFETRSSITLTSFINETNKYIFAINNGNKAQELLRNYTYSNPSSEEIMKAISSFINTEEGFSEHFIFENNNKKFISNCIFNNEHQVSFNYSANYGQMNEVYIINSDISTLSIGQNVDKIVIKNSKIDTLKFENTFKEIEAINSTISEIEKTNQNNYISVQKILVDNTNFNDKNFIKLINETSNVQYNTNGFDLYLDNIYEEIDLSKMIKPYQLNEWNKNLFEINSTKTITGDEPELSVNNSKFNNSVGSRNDINTSTTGFSKIKSFVVNNSYLKRTDLLKYTNPYLNRINVNNYNNSADTIFVKKIKDNNFEQLFDVQHSDVNQVAIADEIKSKQYLFAELKEYKNTFSSDKFEVIKYEVQNQKYNFDFIISRLDKLLLKNSFIEGENIINELSTDIKLVVNEKIKFYNQLLSVGVGSPINIEFNKKYEDNGENSNIKEEIKRWLATKFFAKKSQNINSINTYYNCWMGLSDQIGINTLEFTGNFINKEFTNQTYKTISNSKDWNDVTTYRNNSDYIKDNIKY
ncbi:hypothetical protein ACJA25_02220 [Mycoplasmopsis hyopharyngis]|uniref:hypothetical protein n=1 Tax=Mycoplasmopsis hyopharyngis TaxID=29558 RepID=UPI0038730D05